MYFEYGTQITKPTTKFTIFTQNEPTEFSGAQ